MSVPNGMHETMRRSDPPRVVLLTDERGHLLTWSPAAQKIFGYPEMDVVGKPSSMVLPDLQLSGEAWPRGINGQTVETVGVTREGAHIPLELTLASYDREGQRLVAALVNDLTAARVARQRLFLQDRLAAVGELAAGMAHDFNNILGTIILYSELMLTWDDLPAAVRERTETILEQAKRGATLTTQVLDFSRRSVTARQAMNLVEFLTDVEQLLQRTLPANIRMEIVVRGDGFWVKADPARMQQVVMNLALNARDAMPSGGELTFLVDQLRVERREKPPYRDMRPGGWVRLRVTDTGEGIQSDHLPHIFEPFFTTKSPGVGTGLGLAQVYGIVKRHRGYIDVESEVGAGTTFTIYLPLASEQVADSGVAAPASTPGGEVCTVLVVEDNDPARAATAQILSSLGCHVMDAPNGQQAIALAEEHADRIDLVFCDMVLPDIDGKAVARRMRKLNPAPQVVLMTGYAPSMDTMEPASGRRQIWLQKPFTTADVEAVLREVVG